MGCRLCMQYTRAHSCAHLVTVRLSWLARHCGWTVGARRRTRPGWPRAYALRLDDDQSWIPSSLPNPHILLSHPCPCTCCFMRVSLERSRPSHVGQTPEARHRCSLTWSAAGERRGSPANGAECMRPDPPLAPPSPHLVATGPSAVLLRTKP